jgi:hypothetical protein
MSGIEERLVELNRHVGRILGTTIDLDNKLAAVKRRLDQFEETQNYALRAFFQMHPERFSDLNRSDDDAAGIAFRAFVRTHPDIFTDLDHADQILGVEQPPKKPKA